MDDQVRSPARRLIQLAINDAVQSRLCLISPIKSLMEKEKRDRRKVNKITVWTESNCQKSDYGRDVFDRESVKGIRTYTPEVKLNCPSNKSLYNAMNPSEPVPSSMQPSFYDKNKNEPFNQYTRNHFNSPVLSNSSNFNCGGDMSSPLAPTFSGCNGSNVDAFPCKTSVSSQPTYPSYNCVGKSIPAKQTETELNFNSNYNLPVLSRSCEADGSKPFGTSLKKGDSVSEIPKMSSDLLNHSTLHFLDNSLRDPTEESLSDFIPPPVAASHGLNVSEQDNLYKGEVEIPAPQNRNDSIYSPKLNTVLRTEEQFTSYGGNPTYSDKKRVINDLNYLKTNSTTRDYTRNSDPHFSTLKHFKDLIYDSQETHSSLITVTTSDLELKIVSNYSQLDDYDTGYAISKPRRVNADYLVDSFLNLNTEPMNAGSNGATFNNRVHATKRDNYIFRPQCSTTSNHLENNQGKLTGDLRRVNSSNLLQHFPNYDFPHSHTNAKISLSNPSFNNDKLIYPGNFASSNSCSKSPESTLQFKTLYRNCSPNSESKLSHLTNVDYSLFNPDVSMHQTSFLKSDNVNTEQCEKIDILNPPSYNWENSKLVRSVDVLNTSFSEEDSSVGSNFNVSCYEDDALELSKMKDLGSFDSGIGLTREEVECDSIWDLPLKPANGEFAISATMLEKTDRLKSFETTSTSDWNIGNLTTSQLSKNILSPTRVKFS